MRLNNIACHHHCCASSLPRVYCLTNALFLTVRQKGAVSAKLMSHLFCRGRMESNRSRVCESWSLRPSASFPLFPFSSDSENDNKNGIGNSLTCLHSRRRLIQDYLKHRPLFGASGPRPSLLVKGIALFSAETARLDCFDGLSWPIHGRPRSPART